MAPAQSESQRRLFAIAEHEPSKLHKANADLAKLPKQTLHDFAATKGLKANKSLSVLGSGKRKARTL